MNSQPAQPVPVDIPQPDQQSLCPCHDMPCPEQATVEIDAAHALRAYLSLYGSLTAIRTRFVSRTAAFPRTPLVSLSLYEAPLTAYLLTCERLSVPG